MVRQQVKSFDVTVQPYKAALNSTQHGRRIKQKMNF
jgi:hypothetical protein